MIDIGPADATDRDLWSYAIRNEAAIITKDEDFSTLGGGDETDPAVVWIRVGNMSRRALLSLFEPLLDRIVSMIRSGERLIEIS